VTYPSVFRRYLSALLDLLVIWMGVFLIIQIPALSGSNQTIGIVVGVFVLTYEPVLTSYFCTAGQWLFRFRVRTFDGHNQISIGHAYGRLIIKYLLGIISILTIPSRADRRAIHDFATDTIVIEASADDL
jgi:uncharacterized RDD family membrane protein YckC